MVKDLEWLKEEVEKDIHHVFAEGDIYYVSREHILGLINQLDTPDLSVIPDYVAEWIEENNHKYDNVKQVFDDYKSRPRSDGNMEFEVYSWISKNMNTFFTAYLVGYTVEGKKYRVILQEELDEEAREIPMFFPEHKWYVHLDEDGRIAGTPELNNVPKLTEQEIKDHDPRYFAFAEEVTE